MAKLLLGDVMMAVISGTFMIVKVIKEIKRIKRGETFSFQQ